MKIHKDDNSARVMHEIRNDSETKIYFLLHKVRNQFFQFIYFRFIVSLPTTILVQYKISKTQVLLLRFQYIADKLLNC